MFIPFTKQRSECEQAWTLCTKVWTLTDKKKYYYRGTQLVIRADHQTKKDVSPISPTEFYAKFYAKEEAANASAIQSNRLNGANV